MTADQQALYDQYTAEMKESAALMKANVGQYGPYRAAQMDYWEAETNREQVRLASLTPTERAAEIEDDYQSSNHYACLRLAHA